MRFSFILGLLTFLAAGCSLRSGLVRDSVTNVQIEDSNFRYVKTGLSATQMRGYIFCSIGLPPDNMYDRLMADLHSQAKLGQGETFANLREDSNYSIYLGLFCLEKATISADVIQFGEPAQAAAPAAGE